MIYKSTISVPLIIKALSEYTVSRLINIPKTYVIIIGGAILI